MAHMNLCEIHMNFRQFLCMEKKQNLEEKFDVHVNFIRINVIFVQSLCKIYEFILPFQIWFLFYIFDFHTERDFIT